jgi:hypothetical protein
MTGRPATMSSNTRLLERPLGVNQHTLLSHPLNTFSRTPIISPHPSSLALAAVPANHETHHLFTPTGTTDGSPTRGIARRGLHGGGGTASLGLTSRRGSCGPLRRRRRLGCSLTFRKSRGRLAGTARQAHSRQLVGDAAVAGAAEFGRGEF